MMRIANVQGMLNRKKTRMMIVFGSMDVARFSAD